MVKAENVDWRAPCTVCVIYLDIQFYHVIRHLTDLEPSEIYDVFDMLDTDGSGKIDFDEFYLLFCILVAHKVSEGDPLFDSLY